MKKYLLPLIIGGSMLIIGGGGLAFWLINQNNTTKNNVISVNFSEPICDQIPASVINEATDQDILKTTSSTNSITNMCKYYLDETNFVSLRLNKLSYDNQKSGQQTLGRTITTNSKISGEHFIAVQEDGLINGIVLKINDDLFITIDRSSSKLISEDQIIDIAAMVSEYLNNGSTQSAGNDQTKTDATLQNDEGFITNFYKLIDDGKASEAVELMTLKNTSDDSTKQAWGVQFNDMKSIKVTSLEAYNQDSWTDSSRQYKVTLDIKMDPDSASAPIPYYGYENGKNTRFINLVKENGVWRIDGIATGA